MADQAQEPIKDLEVVPENKVKMETLGPVGEELQRQTEGRDGVDSSQVKEDGEKEKREVEEEEEEDDSCDSDGKMEDTGMGMTVRGWGDAGAETVVLASDIKLEHGDDDDERYSDMSDEDENEVHYDDEDDDGSDDEMFTDDVLHLYAAYQSVLATDSSDLDPLDTSVLEDPYADLPPICEDDELGTSEFSKTGEESIGFEDSNAQTVLPALSKNVLGEVQELATDELLSKEVFSGSAEPEQDIPDPEEIGTEELLEVSGMSGGIVVTEGKVAQLGETGTDVVLKISGDKSVTVESCNEDSEVLGEETITILVESECDNQAGPNMEEPSITNNRSKGKDVVDMDSVSKGKYQKSVTIETTVREVVC
jgi:hypothetical protein